MPTFDDSPSSEGATNVSLHQRSATAPFAREVVNIQGDENPGRAIGFDAEGRLTTLLVGSESGSPSPVELVDMAPLPRGVVIGRKSSGVGVPEAVTVAEMITLDVAGTKTALGKVALSDMANLASGMIIGRTELTAGVPEATTVAEMTALDPESVRTALNVREDPFVTVDTQVEFDAALTAGRSMILRGEGTGGVISLTTPKSVTARFTTIKSDSGAVLSFTTALQGFAAHLRRGITIHADDVTLANFSLTSAHSSLATNNCYGLAFSEGTENHGHRLKVLNMRIYNWQRCISKDGSPTTSSHNDVLFDRLYAHTAKEYVCHLNFGFNHLIMRDSYLYGWLPGTLVAGQITTDNAVFGGSNWHDCAFDNCHFGNVGRMGFEATTASMLETDGYFHERTRLHWCRAENCGSMGFSLGFVTNGIFEKCRAANVEQCGFEVAGSVLGDPETPVGHPGFFATAIIESCEVDGVTHTGPAYGISIDGASDTHVRGATKISNITTSLTDGACGVGLTSSTRCSVKLADFTDCGHKYIYSTKGHLANTTGFHVFENNTFRNSGAAGENPCAVYVDDQTVSVRNNVMYQKTGTTFSFASVTYASCNVYCDGVAVANSPPPAPDPIPVLFSGTNITIPVP